ncbi:MAG: MFS transporter [Chloroflexota bacterium]
MNRSLIWLGAALFTWGIGEAMFMIFQPIYLQQLGASPLAIGGILGAAGLMMTLVPIPAGHISDLWGRKQMLIAAWVFGIMATIIMALAKNLFVFVVGVLLYGITLFVVSPLDSYLTAARGKWSVARVFTFSGIAYNSGVMIGPALGGWIGDHYGLRMIYTVSAGIFIFSTFLIFQIGAQPRDHHDPEAPPAGLLTNKRYLGFLGVFFIVALAVYLPQPFTPSFLENQRGLSLIQIGTLGSIVGVGTVVFNFLLGMLEARNGFLIGQIGVAAYALLLWKGTGFGWFAIAYFMLGGFRALRGLGVAQVRPLVHESQMGLAYGVAETVGASTSFIIPPLAGYLYSLNPFTIYPIALIAIAVGFVVSFIFAPHSKHVHSEHVETHLP